MGSAPSNRGIPATPRDGAPIELTAMLFSVISFLSELSNKEKFLYSGVNTKNGQLSYKNWGDLIYNNFERCYFIPGDNR